MRKTKSYTQVITVSVKGSDDVATIDSRTVATGEVTGDGETRRCSDIRRQRHRHVRCAVDLQLLLQTAGYGSISIDEDNGNGTYHDQHDADATQALTTSDETETFHRDRDEWRKDEIITQVNYRCLVERLG